MLLLLLLPPLRLRPRQRMWWLLLWQWLRLLSQRLRLLLLLEYAQHVPPALIPLIHRRMQLRLCLQGGP